jgi:hypothetical protein
MRLKVALWLKPLDEFLATAPEKFTVENLQKAHAIQYGKALVEIISMVKHASPSQSRDVCAWLGLCGTSAVNRKLPIIPSVQATKGAEQNASIPRR